MRKFILLAAFSAATTLSGATVIEDKAELPILTPSLAKRQTLKLRLDNGLEAYLVSDPEVEKSTGIMSVMVGSWQDPEEHQGIAHFLEHMLFLGTQKYPNEKEYMEFINDHGGMTNAFTANDMTAFLFNVDNDVFPLALDRFADFFKEPLFNPSGVNREKNAVDQEFAKNLESDDMRQLWLMKEQTARDHPNITFQMGNNITLANTSRETLMQWYRDHYSANLMRLMVVSNLPLDELKDLVINDFEGIPNSNKPRFIPDKMMMDPAFAGQIVFFEPVKNERSVTVVWDIPLKFAAMRDSKPEKLLCYVLGHEGAESLLAQLKRENLAEALACGGQRIGGQNMLMYLDITLTRQGLQDVNTVLERVFQAVRVVQQQGISRQLFDEMQTMEKVEYQYQPRTDSFYQLVTDAQNLAEEDMSTFPEQSAVTKRYDLNAVKDLSALFTPQNAYIYIKAPRDNLPVSLVQREKWLGVNYAVMSVAPETLNKWAAAPVHPNIRIPGRNPYIPADLKAVSDGEAVENSLPHPAPIVNDERAIAYFAKDDQFMVPKVSWIFTIKTPRINDGEPKSQVLTDLYIRAVEDYLANESYLARMGGLSYDLEKDHYGLKITINGYHEKAPLLLEAILRGMRKFSMDDADKFRNYKESLAREYANFSKESPLNQALEEVRDVIYKDYTTKRMKAAAIKKITLREFKQFCHDLFARSFVEALLYGNSQEAIAEQAVRSALAILDSAPYPKEEQPLVAVAVMPQDQGPYYLNARTDAQGNAAVLAIEYEPFSLKARAAQQVLEQVIHTAFFSELRTKQQTGYIVTTAIQEVEKHLFNFFAVQSSTHHPRDLLARFELFIESFLQEPISEERFEAIRSSLVAVLKKGPKNTEEMGDLLNRLAFDYDGDFEWMDKRREAMETLTYQEFLTFKKELLGRKNNRRLGVLMHGKTPEEDLLSYKPAKNIAELKKVMEYTPQYSETIEETDIPAPRQA